MGMKGIFDMLGGKGFLTESDKKQLNELLKFWVATQRTQTEAIQNIAEAMRKLAEHDAEVAEPIKKLLPKPEKVKKGDKTTKA